MARHAARPDRDRLARARGSADRGDPRAAAGGRRRRTSESAWITAGLAIGKAAIFLVPHAVRRRSRSCPPCSPASCTRVRASSRCSSRSPSRSARRSPRRTTSGVSLALGAFVAGVVVGESPFSHQIGADLLPFREAFAVMFFVSVGMLVNLDDVAAHWDRVLIAVRAHRRRQGADLGRARVPAAMFRPHRHRPRGRARSDRRVLVHPRAERRSPSGSSTAGSTR